VLASLAAHDVGEHPVFDLQLVGVWDAWRVMGWPATVYDGLASAVVDERSRLVQPRLEYLREFVYRGDWDIWMRLWSSLDDVVLTWERKRMNEAAKQRSQG